MFALPSRSEIEAAAQRVNPVVPPTPQYTWPLFNARAGAEVWLKHENHTPLGAFKVRGGLVYFDALLRRKPDCRGVVCATRGNHGQSVAFAARRHGLTATVVVPHGNSVEKNAAMRGLGATLVEHGEDFQAALERAQQLGRERGLHAMPSFARELVLGVAVSALDFLRQAPPLDTVYVPIGLGSGVCAMIAARDALGLETRIVGVCSREAPAIARSFAAREVQAHPAATRIADGLACSRPHPDALPHLLQGVERIVEVGDDEVEAAMRACFADTHNVAEGAGASGLAAVLQERSRQAGRRVGAVLTGGNVDAAVFARVLAG
ncbi:MAG: threonine dehydratase [Verrucomicrobia bacterium]|nr:threonine dehydratase [Verrucomicrobiota bacterium]